MESGYKISGHTDYRFQKSPAVQSKGAEGIPDFNFQNVLSHQAECKFSRRGRSIGEDGFSEPTEEELLQVKLERKKKWKREAEYSRLLEEGSLERRYKEKIKVRRYPHGSLTIKGKACNTAVRQAEEFLGEGHMGCPEDMVCGTPESRMDCEEGVNCST